MHANCFCTFQTNATTRTARPSQSSRLLDLYTDTNQPQLSDPCTAHHGPLEYAVGSHLQCCATRIRTPAPSALQTQTLSSLSQRHVGFPPLNRPTFSCASIQHNGFLWTAKTATPRSAQCASLRRAGRRTSDSGANANRSTVLSRCRGPVRGLAARPCVVAGARVHGLPPPTDGGGGRPRERRAGLGGAQLAAGQGDAMSAACL